MAVTIRSDIDTGGRSMRAHTPPGALIKSGVPGGPAGLGVLRPVVIPAVLPPEEFGIWGIIVTTLITLSWLKQLGIADKYIQQDEPDQELAYQKAFTLEFLVSMAFFALIVVVLPIYGAAYGHSEIVLPGIVLAA